MRVDGQLNKKWLSKRNLVTTLGAGYFDAKDAHRDSSLFLGGSYYFDAPLIVQGGVRWNRSTPGAVISRSQYLAVTQGKDRQYFVVLRGEVGRQAYQALGAGAILVDFPVTRSRFRGNNGSVRIGALTPWRSITKATSISGRA